MEDHIMKNPRYAAMASISKKTGLSKENTDGSLSERFAAHVFDRSTMQKMLPKEVCKNLFNAMDGRDKMRMEHADAIAIAMKEWAMGLGATHYSHWFHPLTSSSAEKHDSFIEWSSDDRVIEKFSGKQLLQGEPDASSFPSGGLRTTSEARGYTGWDPTSPAFVWKAGESVTLCIPSIFFSWTGDVLDAKIPLLRSDKKINDAVLRLLKLTGLQAHKVYSTLGCEQEYFIVDRVLGNLRPDLVLMGRTVFGASSAKGQELQDHYFGPVKERILAYMRDFEVEALKLGIPVKTRHNEVAPGQYEVAPVFEKASKAIDHNILLMELMKRMAIKHELCCLLHEKPFQGLNGSGKHCNWSLSTDNGLNLLDPTDTPENEIHFLILLVAILKAVHRHAGLLRASVAYAANDFRLGGHEAPPPIISVYLGHELESILFSLESSEKRAKTAIKRIYELGLDGAPDLIKDDADRNRTSPFAFTGNKFEFRAVGSSANPAFPVTVLNTIVAESLDEILNEIEDQSSHKQIKTQDQLIEAIMPVLKKAIIESKAILFSGDNYSVEWQQEAASRGLPVLKKAAHAFDALKTTETRTVFRDVLTSQELDSRYEIAHETYAHTLDIEAKLMLEICRTHVLPAAYNHQKMVAESVMALQNVLGESANTREQKNDLQAINRLIEAALAARDALDSRLLTANEIEGRREKSLFYCDQVQLAGNALRQAVDALEAIIGDDLWLLPKYRELLFVV
jgi:glutamine synthetase